MSKIDVRGLSCPAPVLETKAALEKDHPLRIEVLVDNEPAQKNVTRFLESQGYHAETEQTDTLLAVIGVLDTAVSQPEPSIVAPKSAETKIMVMVSSDCMGSGDDLLGSRLMVNFIKTLTEMGDELWRLVFVNSGVKLTTEGSDSLPDLLDLEKAGFSILVCGTCLDHFDLLEKKMVGQTTNMLDIVTSMQMADKVINM